MQDFATKILDQSRNGIILLNRNMQILYINSAVERIFQISSSEAYKKKIFFLYQCVRKEDEQLLAHQIQEVVKNHITFLRTKPKMISLPHSAHKRILQEQLEPFSLDEKTEGILMTIFDVSQEAEKQFELYDQPRYAFKNPFMTRIAVAISKDAWLYTASKMCPDVRFITHGFMIEPTSDKGVQTTPESQVAISLISFQSEEYKKIIQLIEDHPSVISIERWDSYPDIILSVRNTRNYIYPYMQKYGIILNFPTLTFKNTEIFQLSSSKDKVIHFLKYLREKHLPFKVLSHSQGQRLSSKRFLCKDEEAIMSMAKEKGYFASPRGITLSELARSVKINNSQELSPGALSKKMRKIFQKLLLYYETGETLNK